MGWAFDYAIRGMEHFVDIDRFNEGVDIDLFGSSIAYRLALLNNGIGYAEAEIRLRQQLQQHRHTNVVIYSIVWRIESLAELMHDPRCARWVRARPDDQLEVDCALIEACALARLGWRNSLPRLILDDVVQLAVEFSTSPDHCPREAVLH